jgi:hypothetical protein
MFFTKIDTLVPSLYHCVETEAFWRLSRFRTSVSTSSSSAKRLPPRWNRITRQTLRTRSRKQFFMNTLCIDSFYTQNAQHNAALRWHTLQARSAFWLLKPASEHTHVLLLLRLSRSWTVLRPIDTHRKHVTSITAVLLRFVNYLLTSSYQRAGIAHSIHWLATDWTTKGSELESRWEQEFSLLHVVQTGSGIHPASYPVGTGDLSSGLKRPGAWSWPLTSN